VNGSAGRRNSGLEVESETVAATPPTVRQLATYDYMVVEEGAGRPVVDKILCRLEIESVYGSFVVAARMVCGRSMFGNESQSADDRRRRAVRGRFFPTHHMGLHICTLPALLIGCRKVGKVPQYTINWTDYKIDVISRVPNFYGMLYSGHAIQCFFALTPIPLSLDSHARSYLFNHCILFYITGGYATLSGQVRL
jgi:hypothetical protein